MMPPSTAQTILLVDDDPDVLELTTACLSGAGYHVLEAADAAAALAHIAADRDIELLVVDYAMPTMNGDELATRIRDLRPDLPVLLMSGYDDNRTLDGLGGRIERIKKPFRIGDLQRLVEICLAG